MEIEDIDLDIAQEDLDSGKVVQNEHGTFWFKEPGNNVDKDGLPVWENLHRNNGPAAVWANDVIEFYVEGKHMPEREFNNRIDPFVELPGGCFRIGAEIFSVRDRIFY